MATDVSDKYVPNSPPGDTDIEAVKQWTFRELARLGGVLQEQVAVDLRPIYRAITRPREGTLIYADGTSYNPSAGKGVYVYRDNDWFPLDKERVCKLTDEGRASNTTLTNDGALVFSVVANAKYFFRFVVFYDTPTAADLKFDINGPAAPTLLQIATQVIAPGATAYSAIALQTAFAFGPTVVTETAGTNGMIVAEGILQNGNNAGTVAFRWAQNTSNVSNTTVRGGSYVAFGKVA